MDYRCYDAIYVVVVAAFTKYDLLPFQLKAGPVKMHSRLEEEELTKAALVGRIQRLTKLILVSTKNTTQSNIPEGCGIRQRHSFGEDEVCVIKFQA